MVRFPNRKVSMHRECFSKVRILEYNCHLLAQWLLLSCTLQWGVCGLLPNASCPGVWLRADTQNGMCVNFANVHFLCTDLEENNNMYVGSDRINKNIGQRRSKCRTVPVLILSVKSATALSFGKTKLLPTSDKTSDMCKSLCSCLCLFPSLCDFPDALRTCARMVE